MRWLSHGSIIQSDWQCECRLSLRESMLPKRVDAALHGSVLSRSESRHYPIAGLIDLRLIFHFVCRESKDALGQ